MKIEATDSIVSTMAKLLGSKGGRANSPAQIKARKLNAKKAGRIKLMRMRTATPA